MDYRTFRWKTPARVTQGNVIYLKPRSENITITKTEPIQPMYQVVFGVVIAMFFVLLFGPGARFSKK